MTGPDSGRANGRDSGVTPRVVPAPITAVTVLEDRASVTRHASISVPAGQPCPKLVLLKVRRSELPLAGVM